MFLKFLLKDVGCINIIIIIFYCDRQGSHLQEATKWWFGVYKETKTINEIVWIFQTYHLANLVPIVLLMTLANPGGTSGEMQYGRASAILLVNGQLQDGISLSCCK